MIKARYSKAIRSQNTSLLRAHNLTQDMSRVLVDALLDAASSELNCIYYGAIAHAYLSRDIEAQTSSTMTRVLDQAHFDFLAHALSQFGSNMPFDLREFPERTIDRSIFSLDPDQLNSPFIALLECKISSIRAWNQVFELSETNSWLHEASERICSEELEHELWIVKLLNAPDTDRLRRMGQTRHSRPMMRPSIAP